MRKDALKTSAEHGSSDESGGGRATDTRAAHIELYLRGLREKRVNFAFPTDLAEMVAEHLSAVEGKACSRTTILRNVRYRVLIDAYMEGHSAKLNRAGELPSNTSVAANINVVQTALEISNLRRENERLQQYVNQLRSELSVGMITIDAKTEPVDNGNEVNFVRTCQALFKVLEFASVLELVKIDSASKTIIDPASLVDNVIVETKLSLPFFEWLKANNLRL